MAVVAISMGIDQDQNEPPTFLETVLLEQIHFDLYDYLHVSLEIQLSIHHFRSMLSE